MNQRVMFCVQRGDLGAGHAPANQIHALYGLACLIESIIAFAQSYGARVTSTTKNGTNLAILDRLNCIALLLLDTNQAASLFGEARILSSLTQMPIVCEQAVAGGMRTPLGRL
jgi:hypothetical protein